ncbi:MAG: hypothetical protein KDA84_10480, partial [Planctomycetaceae bacterium]|nr:hypothetical protein [Planctomycetaceae bacterium]
MSAGLLASPIFSTMDGIMTTNCLSILTCLVSLLTLLTPRSFVLGDEIPYYAVVAFSDDNSRFVCIDPSLEVTLWNSTNGEKIRRLSSPKRRVDQGEGVARGMAKLSPNGKRLVVVIQYGQWNPPHGIIAWDTTSGEILRELNLRGTTILDIGFLDQSPVAALVDHNSHKISIRDIVTNKEV